MDKAARNLNKPKATQKAAANAAFHEVMHNKPSTVDTSKSAKGQHKQMVAIALSKAGLSKPGKRAK